MTFKLRTHTEDFRTNFKGSYEDHNCPLGNAHPDSQYESAKNCIFTKFDETDKEKYGYIFSITWRIAGKFRMEPAMNCSVFM